MAKKTKTSVAHETIETIETRPATPGSAGVPPAQIPARDSKPQTQDPTLPPKMGAKEVMASFKVSMEILRNRRLAALAAKHPEIAKLLKAQKLKTAAELPAPAAVDGV